MLFLKDGASIFTKKSLVDFPHSRNRALHLCRPVIGYTGRRAGETGSARGVGGGRETSYPGPEKMVSLRGWRPSRLLRVTAGVPWTCL